MKYVYMQNIAKGFIGVAAFAVIAACNNQETSINNGDLPDEAEESSDIIHLSDEQIEVSGIKLNGFDDHIFHNRVSATGMIDVPPAYKASVSTYFAGYVSEIDILPGQKVQRGEELFTLENPEYVSKQQEFLDAKAQLAYLKTDYERQKNLLEDQVSSEKKYTKAETEYQTMLARYQALRKQLELMRINPDELNASQIASKISVRAPISGYLGNVFVNKGMYLNPSDIATTIINPDHLHIELSIFEKDLKYLKPGQQIVFNLLNDPENKYNAEVYLVGKSVDPEKRTINVHGHLLDENLNALFAPGMYVEAEIYTSSESLLSLPNEAILNSEDRYYVVQQQKNEQGETVYVKQEIKPGKRDNAYTQVLNSADFSENPSFITEGGFNLFMD